MQAFLVLCRARASADMAMWARGFSFSGAISQVSCAPHAALICPAWNLKAVLMQKMVHSPHTPHAIPMEASRTHYATLLCSYAPLRHPACTPCAAHMYPSCPPRHPCCTSQATLTKAPCTPITLPPVLGCTPQAPCMHPSASPHVPLMPPRASLLRPHSTLMPPSNNPDTVAPHATFTHS